MGKINAKIFSILRGYKAYENCDAIKIRSNGYNLLIMEDYLPVIGQIDGDITFVQGENQETIDKITGYYRHAHNEFELLIKSDD